MKRRKITFRVEIRTPLSHPNNFGQDIIFYQQPYALGHASPYMPARAFLPGTKVLAKQCRPGVMAPVSVRGDATARVRRSPGIGECDRMAKFLQPPAREGVGTTARLGGPRAPRSLYLELIFLIC